MNTWLEGMPVADDDYLLLAVLRFWPERFGGGLSIRRGEEKL